VHPREGDQGPCRDCGRCVCCIRAELDIQVYVQVWGSQPVKSTIAVKMILERVVLCCWHACLLFTKCSRPVELLRSYLKSTEFYVTWPETFSSSILELTAW
jgi:hypothetical protein